MHDWQQPKEQAPHRANLKTGLAWALGCGVLISLIWSAAVIKIRHDEQQLIDQLQADTTSRAHTMAEQLLRTVSQIDQLSMAIKYQWERRAGPLDLEEQYRRGVYRESLYPVAIDASGRAVTSTRNLARGTYMGDLDFFRNTRSDSLSQLLISPPTEGRGGFAGKQIVRFSRRFEKPDGSFDGVVLIAVEVGYLVSFHDITQLPAGDFISVRFADGNRIVTRTGGKEPPPLLAEPARYDGAEGSRLEPANAFIDREPRMVSWKRLDGYPLVLVAASGVSNALAPYQSTRNSYQAIAAMASFLLLAFAGYGATTQLRNSKQRRHEAQIQATFRLAVDAAREAFYMLRPVRSATTSDWVFEDCNERAAEMQLRPRAELIGRALSELFDQKEGERLRAFCLRVQKEGFVEDEFHVRHGKQHAPGWFQRRGIRSGSGIAVTVRDVSEARQQADTLARMARTDALTGLPNRHWLNDYLASALERAQRSGQRLALLYIDLDNFKDINDALGHRVGDKVLMAVARTLRATLREQDQLARLGGDEFTVLVEGLGGEARTDSGRIADKLISAIARMGADSAWRAFNLKASIGISLFPDDASDVDSLLRSADIAMYEAKGEGKAQFRHFDEAFAQRIRERISIEHALEQALRRDEFVIYYQPRAYARTGRMAGMEALIRWRHPERGLLSPAEFIGVAEQSGLIVPIGECVIRKVCAQLAAWRELQLPLKQVSINVSALQLKGDGLRHALAASLEAHALPSSLVSIELTESSMLDENGVAQRELQRLRSMGIELEIDDFGTGYSSLSKLQSLDIDVLKIDQSFVRRLGEDPQASSLCETMVSIGRTLKISVVAEGVETCDQLVQLQRMGCDQIQGYLVSPPVPAEQIQALLETSFFEGLPAGG